MNAWGVLKQAVKDAPAGATIKITGTIQAATASGNNGELEITKDLTIEAKSGTATLDANNMHRIFKVTGGTLTLNNMTLKKGKAGTGNGGGVRVGTLGDFTMKNGRITDNVAHHNGKAISVQTNSTFNWEGGSITGHTVGSGDVIHRDGGHVNNPHHYTES